MTIMLQSQNLEEIQRLNEEKAHIVDELKKRVEENEIMQKQEYHLIQCIQSCVTDEELVPNQEGSRAKEANSKKSSSQKKGASKKKEVAGGTDGYIQRELFEKINPKTLSLSEKLVERVNLNRQLLLQENVALSDQVQHMQQSLEAEQRVKAEIHHEFTQIKQKLLLVKKWEDECIQLRKRNEWLASCLQRLNQKHNKLSTSAYGQLVKIMHAFQNDDNMKD